MANNKIQDFGEIIGGARKEQYGYIFDQEELFKISTANLKKYAVKNLLWKNPDYRKQHASGLSREVLYFRKLLRESLSSGPNISVRDTEEELRETIRDYISIVSLVRDFALSVQEIEDIKKGYTFSLMHLQLPSSTARVLRLSLEEINRQIKKKCFLYSEDEKILSSHIIQPIDQCNFETDYNGRLTITYHEGKSEHHNYATHYIYPQAEFCDQSAYLPGTFIAATPGRRVIGINFPTKEAAERAVLSLNEHTKIVTQKKESEKKSKLVPPMLAHIERVGVNEYRHGNVSGEDYIQDFQFRGGEYGNWLTDKDRQASLNFAYDALQDLAYVLHIAPEDIALKGKLAIAFGARGRGNALAHYEPLAHVINITKLRGAGSLAHEWIHAVDFLCGETIGLNGSLTEAPKEKRPASFNRLMNEIKTRPLTEKETEEKLKEELEQHLDSVRTLLRSYIGKVSEEQGNELDNIIENCICEHRASIDYMASNDAEMSAAFHEYVKWQYNQGISTLYPTVMEYRTRRYNINRLQTASILRSLDDLSPTRTKSNFLREAESLDAKHAKTDHGYWSSDVELLARAGAAWIFDKCHASGIRNDYLCGHANFMAPHDDERKRIDAAFDVFFEDLRKLDFVHDGPVEMEVLTVHRRGMPKVKETNCKGNYGLPAFREEANGQLCLCW
ncbi:MAG: hypothetical protein Q4B26_06115 [Eubacteriales bacterium]|nr:hypothetical protein [Eubacteriales bacterium]